MKQKLPPLNGKHPDFQWITKAKQITITNAIAYQEFGPHGALRLCTDAAEYMTLTRAANDYNEPTYPIMPAAPLNETAAAATKRILTHTEDLKHFTIYTGLDRFLAGSLLTEVDDMYVLALAHPILGHSNVTTRQLLQHLVATYGTITTAEITQKENDIRTQWHPTMPIEQLWEQHETIQRYLAGTNGAISDGRLTLLATQNILRTGESDLKKAIDSFEKRPTAELTWANFKLDLTAAYLRLPVSVTSASAGYQANQLTVESHTLHYCWSHGLCDHPSDKCPNKASGHQDKATLDNRMGGCTWIQRIPGEKTVWKNPNRRTTYRGGPRRGNQNPTTSTDNTSRQE